jgi:hypothetical protein
LKEVRAVKTPRWISRLEALVLCGLSLPFVGSCAGSGSTATAAPPAAAEIAVAAMGKLVKGAEGSCRVLHGDDGKDYSFVSSSIDARFKDGDHVCVTGSPTMGFCMQGTQLELQTMDGCH